MSINVTVSNNPVCINRSKVLLTDLDLVKKNEWNRRRKLRLQQVRQQSKDLASDLRKKCDYEKKIYNKQECDKNEEELKLWQAKQLEKLQFQYDNCIAALGTGHRIAASQVEDANVVQERNELRDALAKTRGELARERAKVNASCTKSINNSTKSSGKSGTSKDILPSQKEIRNNNKKYPSKCKIKPASAAESNKKDFNRVHPTECTILSPEMTAKLGQRERKLHPKVMKSVRRLHSCSPTRNKTDNKKVVNLSISDDSDDSIATWPPRTARVANMLISPQKIKFYNHDERACKEYIKPARSVTHIDRHSDDEMRKHIEQEEEVINKLAEQDAAIKKRSATRGQKALSKERVEREFKSLAPQLTETDKQQRIARIFEFPYPVTNKKETKSKGNEETHLNKVSFSKKQQVEGKSEVKSKFQNTYRATRPLDMKENIDQDLNKCFEVGALHRTKKVEKKHDQSLQGCDQNPFTLKNLIKDLEKERDLLLNSTLENSPLKEKHLKDKNNNGNLKEKQNFHKTEIGIKASADRKGGDVESMVKMQKTNTYNKNNYELNDEASPSKTPGRGNVKPPHPLEVNVITKEICDCCNSCTCMSQDSSHSQNEKLARNISVKINHQNQNNKRSFPKGTMDTSTLDPPDPTQLLDSESGKKTSDTSLGQNVSSLVCSSSENDSVKITVKITEKNNKDKCGRQPPPNEEPQLSEDVQNEVPWFGRFGGKQEITSSSSSYCSPPSKLSPTQQDILNFILLKMCVKNNNPRLHKYIKRLLSMSKANIDNLTVSTPSETSIRSDLLQNPKIQPKTGVFNVPRKVHKSEIITPTADKQKVVRVITSSEDSVNDKSDTSVFEDIDNTIELKFNKLADEYSSRLREVIQMLNQTSPKYESAENRDNEISSYIGIPQGQDSLTNSINGYSHHLQNDSKQDCTFEKSEHLFYPDNHTNLDHSRSNLVSLGLPFELLPKPFTLEDEENPPIDSHHRQKPPPSIFKHRIGGVLPHELSAIPEVSSRLCCNESNFPPANLQLENQEFQENDGYLSDIDLLDVSSIKESTPTKMPVAEDQKKSRDKEAHLSSNTQCKVTDMSSLSILSHMTNESLLDFGTDRDVNSFLESPSEYIEEVFRSLGVGWALSTLRKTRQSRQKDSTSTSNSSKNTSYMMERTRSKPTCKKKAPVGHIHSTPKKVSEENSSTSSSFNEELQRKFQALKNNRLSLTPPDLSLNVPNFAGLNNNYNNNAGPSRSAHLRHHT